MEIVFMGYLAFKSGGEVGRVRMVAGWYKVELATMACEKAYKANNT
jgi:hypothetical protein